MKNLISMTDFVLEQEREFDRARVGFNEFTNNVCNYAKFLKQPLELWMFVHCDEDGNVLIKPTKSIRVLGGINIANEKRIENYQRQCEMIDYL